MTESRDQNQARPNGGLDQPHNQWVQPTGRTAAMPKTVNIGSWLVLAAAVVSAANVVRGIVTVGVEAHESALRVQVVNGAIGATTIALYLLVFFFLRKGANWARVLGTVFACIAVALLIMTLPIFLDWVLVLEALLGVAGMVMMYLKPSNPWFRTAAPSYGNQ